MTEDAPPRRLRIAIVAEQVNRRAGQERVIAELSSRLAQRHQVDLFCFTADDLAPDGPRVRRIWCPLRSNTFRALWIVLSSWALVHPRRYDVVLSQGGNCLVQNFVLAHTCHARRRRDLLKPPAPGQHREGRAFRWFLRWRNRWAAAMERRAMRRCAGHIIAAYPELTRILREEYGLSSDQVLTARNAVDHATFHPGVREQWRDAVRQELGLAPDDFVMLFVGGLWHEKGLPQVLEALSRMSAPGHLVVVGHGDEVSFGHRAEQLGVRGRVSFLGRRPEIERYYGAADCFVFPSPIQWQALVTLEAAACGLPVVIARNAATEESFQDGVSAFLVSGSSQELAGRLDQLADDPSLRARLGAAARQAVLPLSWDEQAATVERFLLAKTPAARPAATRAPQPRGDSTRVAVISHSGVISVNQSVYAALAAQHPDVQVLLVVPQTWETPLSGRLRCSVLPGAEDMVCALPVFAPGQINLHWYPGRRLRDLLTGFAPHLVLADEEPYSLAGYQGARLAHDLGARLMVYTKQNLYREYPPPFGPRQHWVLAHTDRALVVSEACEQVLRRRGFAGPVTELPHGVLAELFRPVGASGLRGELGLDSRPVIGYVGRLDQQKGIMDLLEAAAELHRSRGDDFQVLIAGDGPLRRRATAYAQQHLAPEQARFLGYVSHAEIPRYFSLMDALVIPSRTTSHWKEQFGRVLLEALACEVTVVGSDSGHIPYLLQETGGGLTYPEGDVPQLAEKLGWLLDHPVETREMARQGHAAVLARYTVARVADTLYKAVRATLG